MIECLCEVRENDMVHVEKYGYGFVYYSPEIISNVVANEIYICKQCARDINYSIEHTIEDIKSDARRV